MAKSQRSYSELVGQRHGAWIVLEIIKRDGMQTQCRVLCECGNERIRYAHSIRNGDSTSCGCKRSSIQRRRSVDRHKHLIGKRFGRLVVLDVIAGGNAKLKCRCDCGAISSPVAQPNYMGPKAVSCGCDRSATIAAAKTHGQSGTPTYSSWSAMIHRCTNTKRENYIDYGGRGIRVCSGLMNYTHFVGAIGERPYGKTLDRIDNDANYSCGSCDECLSHGVKCNIRWATWSEQQSNKRKRRKGPSPRRRVVAE